MVSSWLFEKANKIGFSNKVSSYTIKDFSAAINLFNKRGGNSLVLDFSEVTHAYPNGMVGILATIELLRSKGINIEAVLPDDYHVRKLFRSVNWAHKLDPRKYKASGTVHDRHLIIRSFDDGAKQKKVVDDFMDVILRSMRIPKDIISGIEWSINEITDNVLNHSNSPFGGLIQVSTYLKSNTIAFAVADSGRGILKSLREGIPTLRTDAQAIGEAIKSGVTRNKEFGQGNGLAGTVKVTTMTGGSFEVTSGSARILTTNDKTYKSKRTYFQYFTGTLVCGQIKIDNNFSIMKALDFGNSQFYPRIDFIDAQYEMKDDDCYYLKLKDETTGFGTRFSGMQLRTKTINLMDANQSFPIIIDWDGVPLISSSFADEFIGKLFLEIGMIAFSSRIRNRNMEGLIRSLIDKAVAQRLTQEKDNN